MALELAKYQTLMGMFFAKHQPQLCIEYDRQAAAQDHTLRWNTIKEDVYMWALTQRQNFCGQNHITSRLGPEPSATKPFSDKATHTTTGKDICKRYNLAKVLETSTPSPMSAGTTDARVSTLAKGAPRRHELQRAHAQTHSHLERETNTSAHSDLEDECGKHNNHTNSHLELTKPTPQGY